MGQSSHICPPINITMTFNMSFSTLLLLCAVLGGQAQIQENTTVPTPPTDPTHPISPICSGVVCPDEEVNGGLFASGECSNYFCECSLGIPYRLPAHHRWSLMRRKVSAIGATTCAISVE